MNTYLIVILALIIGTGLLDIAAGPARAFRRSKARRPRFQRSFSGIYDPEKYAQALRYQATNARFDIVSH